MLPRAVVGNDRVQCNKLRRTVQDLIQQIVGVCDRWREISIVSRGARRRSARPGT